MKVKTKFLSKAIVMAQKVSKKLQMSFEEKSLGIFVSDGNCYINISIPSEGNNNIRRFVIEEVKNFNDCLKTLKETFVELYVDGNELKFNSFSIPVVNESYQDYKEFEGQKGHSNTVSVKAFSSLISQTTYSAATDKSRHTFLCCELTTYSDSFDLVATDGYRLTKTSVNNKNTAWAMTSAYVLAEYLDLLKRFLSDSADNDFVMSDVEDGIRFTVNAKYAKVDMFIPYEKIDYPRYNSIIDASKKDTSVICKINRERALSALIKLKGALVSSNMAVMNVQKDAIIFGDEDSRKFMEKIETEPRVFDKEVEICFNVNYLIDVFENTESEKITMCFTAFNQPACFEGINSFSVLMPMLKDKSRW